MRHQCSAQWRPFLGALAEEFGSQLDVEGARTLMRRLGVSMARTAALPALELLTEMESAMNEVWSAMNWGWVELNDTGAALQIIHHCAPLEVAFGPGSRPWASAVLEGAYEQWLRAAGAGERLRVHQIPPERPGTESVYVFALAA